VTVAGADPSGEDTPTPDRRPQATERGLLRLGAALLISGLFVDGVGGALHASPPNGDPNDLIATFPGIAASDAWTTAHFLQFAASLFVAAALLVLFQAVSLPFGPSVLDPLGRAVTITSAALVAIQYAVDGIALKQAVDAWAAAPPGDKAAAFRIAELTRWLEWATTSYATLLFGIALVLLGIVIARSLVLPTWLGVLIAVPGVLDVISGFILGKQGFSPAVTLVAAPTVILLPATAIALGLIAYRRTPATRRTERTGST
jgi:hypothetical protein